MARLLPARFDEHSLINEVVMVRQFQITCLIACVMALCVGSSAALADGVRTVALTGQSSVGAGGVTWSSFMYSPYSPYAMTLNDAGRVAFAASLSDGREGIWSEGASGVLEPVAVTGSFLPGLPAGVSVWNCIYQIRLNSQGDAVIG